MKKIFISGNLFSWNLGTMAMALSLIEQFSAKNNFFYKASVEVDNDRKRYAKDPNTKNLFIFGFNKGCLPMAFASPLLLIYSLKWTKKADIVLAVSGEVPNDISLFSQFFRFLEAKLFKKKFVVYGCSLGPFKSFIAVFVARIFYNHIEALLVRESATMRYLKKIGVKNALLTSDHTFLLTSRKNPRLEKLKEKAGRFVGISVKHVYFYQCAKYKKEIGELIKYISGVLGMSVILIPHSREDVLPSEIIYNENKRLNSYIVRGDYLPTELKWLISQADFFIGSRIHACIAALSSKIPLLVYIPYSDHRSVGFMSEFGMKNVIVDPFLKKDLVYEFQKNYKIKDEIIQKISRQLPKIKKRAGLNIKIVEEILEKNE